MEAAHLLSISTLLKALSANVRINFYISMKYDIKNVCVTSASNTLVSLISNFFTAHQIQPTLTQEIDEWIFAPCCGYNMQLFLLVCIQTL